MAVGNDPYFDSVLMGGGTLQAETIYNQFIARLTASYGRILSASVSVPPGAPNLQDSYLVPTGASGAWDTLDGKLVVWVNAWRVITPKPGMHVYVVDSQLQISVDSDSVWRCTFGYQTLVTEDDAGTERLNWDTALGRFAEVTLTENTTIFMKPTNMRPGYEYGLYVRQNATGNRLMTYESGAFVTSSALAMVLSPQPLYVDLYKFDGPGGGFSHVIETARVLALLAV